MLVISSPESAKRGTEESKIHSFITLATVIFFYSGCVFFKIDSLVS